jgi:hypothetical protein
MSSITYAEVELAINELLRVKKSITLANLRQQLGDRGSMTTLTKYLQQWKSSKFLEGVPVQTLTEPAPDHIMSAVQTVWHQMIDHGQEQLQQQKQDFEQKQALWQIEQATLEQKITALLEEAKQKKDECAALHHQYQSLHDAHDQLQKKNIQLEESLKKEQEFVQKSQLEAQELKSFLEKTFTLRLEEIAKSYQNAQANSAREVDNLKVLLEQQRHEHLVAFDRLTVEHRQLTILHQQQKTQQELTQQWSLAAEQLKDSFQGLMQSQTALADLSTRTYQSFLERQANWLRYYHPVNFYQKSRVFSY